MVSEQAEKASPRETPQQNGNAEEGRAAETANESNPKSKAKKATTSKKRKAEKDDKPAKAPRRSARGAEKSTTDPVKVINFLLSSEASDLCRPKDEVADIAQKGEKYRTYSAHEFSPFEELMCAAILSRPISHALGLRSIRTLFNDPYNFTSPKTIMDAGFDEVRIALDNARTQHRQKTAEQLCTLATVVVDKFSQGKDDVSLEKVRQSSSRDVDQEREALKSSIKGIGPTGLDIFGRRIQAQWEEWYPFMDARTATALEQFDLPGDPTELKKFLDGHWKEIDSKGMLGKNEEEKKRKLFVMLLERAVGADLEGNLDAVMQNVVNF